ncbi:MAG: PfkB family carbohydrate kinase, partial [Armatimonadota bacterium]
ALVACARLGAETQLCSLLGDDSVASNILDELKIENVGVGGVYQKAGGNSPFSYIHVDTAGERTIFHRSSRALDQYAGEVDLTFLDGSQALIVDDVYPELARRAAAHARQLGIPVVADLIPDEGNRSLVEQVDVLIAPQHYLRSLGDSTDTSKALESIHALGPKTAVITLGEDGAVYSNSGSTSGKIRGFKVDVVDTTGAGDSFHGGFSFGLACGWDTGKCVEFASAVAAIKCMSPGGRQGLPSPEIIKDFLTSRGSLDWSTLFAD